MKFILFIFTIILIVNTYAVAAETDNYDWILKENKKIDQDVIYTTGYIDSKKYIARITNAANKKDEYVGVILISLLNNNEQKLIAAIDLQGDNPLAYGVKIKNNSIYLITSTAHHGVYFTKYQFKRYNDSFRLIGIESQSMTLSDYSVDASELAEPSYKQLEMWAGSSTNLLSSETECWLQRIDSDNLQKAEDANKRFRLELPSTKGVRKKVKFTSTKNLKLPLNNFNFFNNDLDGFVTCYFDYNMKFHNK